LRGLMTTARKEIVIDRDGTYHCISRCVRRAYLCGFDPLSGKNFDHRKEWVVERLKFLVEIFAIEVLNYALMATHAHTLLRLMSKLLDSLSDEEVARRWLRLYPKCDPSDEEELAAQVEMLCLNRPRIRLLRSRLGSVSWFMKSLNEYIARRANGEDECKGRFWEGRFKCQRVEGENAVLSCAIYIDLNPIRAKAAKTPEESVYTSAYERIQELKRGRAKESWLPPLVDSGGRKGYLSVSLPDYLRILDATGREMVHGKRGAIPANLAPILERLGIVSSHWLTTAQHLGRWFSGVVGCSKTLSQAANRSKKSWLKGMRPARLAFE
jgi:hypothetical protein